MELGNGLPDRYKKITFWKQAIDELLVSVFVESQEQRRSKSFWMSTQPTWPYMANRKGASFTATMIITATCRCMCLRRTCTVRPSSASQHRCFCRQPGGDRTDRGTDSEAWPEVKIILRGDSGFCRKDLMAWCESITSIMYSDWPAISDSKIIGRQMWEATEQ